MATLNLSKMKYMSETNLKKFANLIISLSSQVTDVENKCIKPYVDGELYQKDSYVSYNGYIYQATATNQDGAFNEAHWDKLSDDFNELTVADIEAMLGLSSEQLETMANLIADTEVRLDKTYSSSKIYQDIQQCLNDSKAFTLLELGKFSGASYKVVASTSEMTSESIIYLLASGNTYDMYIVEEDGTTTKIGNMDVNLDNYFTKAEIEADYLKKVDADGKYATITTVDGKVDKTDIVDNLTSIDIDKPLSANQGKVLKDEVDLKANASEVVKKTDIATTIDSDSTDDKVPSAKAINELNLRGTLIDQSVMDKYGTEIVKYPCGRWYFAKSSLTRQFSDIPWNEACIIDITSIAPEGNPWTDKWNYRNYKAQTIAKRGYFIRQLESRETGGILVDTGWQKVCATTVADVSKTVYSLDTSCDGVYKKGDTNTDNCWYAIRNGWCIVQIDLRCLQLNAGYICVSTSLPKPIATIANVFMSNDIVINEGDKPLIIIVGGDGVMKAEGGKLGGRYIGTFSYPVAE